MGTVGDLSGGASGAFKDPSLSDGENKLMNAGINAAMAQAIQLKKADHYKAVVANTPRGKMVQKGADNWNKAFGSPMAKMKMMKGGKAWGGMGGAGAGKTASSSSSSDKDKTDNSKASADTTPDYDYGNSYNNNSYGSNTSSTYGSNTPDYSKKGKSVPNTTNTSYLLDSVDKNKRMFKRDDSDSLFKIVSKAYYRNLSLMLTRQNSFGESDALSNDGKDLEFKQKNKINSKKKNELKGLLSN